MTYYWPSGTLARSGSDVLLTPRDAGWTYTGLQVETLNGVLEFATADREFAIIPLSGGLRVEVEDLSFELEGRPDVFSRVTDWAYIPLNTEVRLQAPRGTRVALASSLASRCFEPAYVPAESVTVEIRGSGPATRQVTNFMSPEAFGGADHLMCVELLTPDGNWSSYPPHRHDASPECPVNNEEIYYFEIGSSRDGGVSSEGFGLYHGYQSESSFEQTLVVRHGDVVTVPFGYHGPCVAAPGYPMYYLNVLAGPHAQRSMAFCDDPTHHWVRAAWETMSPDSRCPMTSFAGKVQ